MLLPHKSAEGRIQFTDLAGLNSPPSPFKQNLRYRSQHNSQRYSAVIWGHEAHDLKLFKKIFIVRNNGCIVPVAEVRQFPRVFPR